MAQNISYNGEKKGQKKDRTLPQAKKELQESVEKAKALLIDTQIQEAIEEVNRAIMELKEDLGGESSVLLLPGYFILAESYIAEKQLKKAEDFLIAAYWNFSKYNKKLEKRDDNQGQDDNKKDIELIDEEEALSYRGTLHKTFSKLFLAQKDYNKALDELKNGIYMDCMKYGPEDYRTSINYFQMGNIFLQKKSIPEAEAFYGKTSEIWYKYFKIFFKQNNDQNDDDNTDNMVVKEACDILQTIQMHFEEMYQEEDRKKVFIPLIDTYRALALIFKYANDDERYRKHIQMALEECTRWEGEKKTQKKQEKLRKNLEELIEYQD